MVEIGEGEARVLGEKGVRILVHRGCILKV